MCGSLLSKFKSPRNEIHPATISFAKPSQAPSQMKLAEEDVAWFEDKAFSKDGTQNGESSVQSLAMIPSKSSLKGECSCESDSSSQDEIEAVVRALADKRRDLFPSKNYKNYRLRVVDRDQQLLETAREILSFQLYGTSSSSNTIRAIQPLSSTASTFPKKLPAAMAFDIPAGNKKTICPPARVPRRFRKRKVAPELTLVEMKEKMRAAEERKLKELECIRESARSRARVSRPHPAEASAQATAAKIAAKQAAAERKHHEEIEKRKQAGNKTSRNRSRIAAAQAFARTQLQSSIQRKEEDTEQRKAKRQLKIDRQNKMRAKYAKKVKERVSYIQCHFV